MKKKQTRYLLFALLLTLIAALLIVTTLKGSAEVLPPEPVVTVQAKEINITPFINSLFALLGMLITYRLVPLIRANTTIKQQGIMRAAVSVAVHAAEQIFGVGEGKKKLMYVKGQLAKKGILVDIDEIEAAVREMNLLEDILNPPDDEEDEEPGDDHGEEPAFH